VLDVLPQDHRRPGPGAELTKDDYRSPIPKKHQWRTWAADPEGITGEELQTFVNDELFPALNRPDRLIRTLAAAR
jgi:hypothetical protein